MIDRHEEPRSPHQLPELRALRPNADFRTAGQFPLQENGSQQPSDILHAWRKSPVLLLSGESGTGKTHLARRLHAETAPPLLLRELHCRYDCADVETLLNSQQPASSRHRAVSASSPELAPRSDVKTDVGATLLLREVEALSECRQLQLMRYIEQDLSSRPWRLVLTTRCDLQAGPLDSGLRADLFYRVSVFGYRLNPLRERGSEIWRLARQFVSEYAEQYQKKIDRIETGFSRKLLEYSWPGNVRELKHVIERAVIHCTHGLLATEHLPPVLRGEVRSVPPTEAQAVASRVSPELGDSGSLEVRRIEEESLERSVADVERVQIEQALQRNLQSRTHAARELGISRVTLYNKMKKLGLETVKPHS